MHYQSKIEAIVRTTRWLRSQVQSAFLTLIVKKTYPWWTNNGKKQKWTDPQCLAWIQSCHLCSAFLIKSPLCWLRLFFLLVLVRLAMVVSSCWSPSRLVNLLPPVVVLLLPCYGGFDLFFVVSYCVLFCILVCIGPMTASSFSFSPAPAMLLLLDGFFF